MSNIIALQNWIKENGAWNKSNNYVNCKICGKSFHSSPSANRSYCSRVCADKRTFPKGENSHSWRGGKPRCIECNKQLVGYYAKRCQKHAAKSNPHLQRGAYRKSHPGISYRGSGWKHSEATKKKISQAHVGMDKPWLHTEEVIKKALKRRTPSGLENRIIKTIDKYNLPYKFVGDGKFFIEKKNPDFVNTNGEKIALEVYYKKHKDLFRGGAEKWKINRGEIFKKYGWDLIFIEGKELTESKILKVLQGGITH